MVQIVGKYQYVSNENFEEFMKALGHAELVNPFLQAKPLIDVQRNGDQWTIVVTSGDRTTTASFKLNEPYEEKLPSSDRKFKSVTTLDGNNFRTETQVSDTLKVIRVYEFLDTEMKVYLSMNKGDLKATRTYKRL
ncbi:PREDICTED: fatty acid-binding protein, liver-type-like [Eufriesea mexicana]|uniref:fatty acid-binding protein, liver-type-like n=1 Tax=Eufriesea mexicana TaxID=516756 RepID=UPI00083BAC0B|nr:PREDICTED: fatty acid-binding protein, liver-type-like [Eufriesea mexicana]